MKLKTTISIFFLAMATAFAVPQKGQFPVSYFLGSDTNQAGTNFLSATNAAQARARIEVPGYADVTNIAQQYGGGGSSTNYSGIVNTTNLPASVPLTTNQNAFTAAQTFSTATVTNLTAGSMIISARYPTQ